MILLKCKECGQVFKKVYEAQQNPHVEVADYPCPECAAPKDTGGETK